MTQTPRLFREVTKTDRSRKNLYIILAVAFTSLSGWFFAREVWSIEFVLWGVIVTGGSLLFIKWLLNSSAYRCSECGNEFQISLATFFVSRQAPDKKYLKCPTCGKKQWATELTVVP